MLPFRSRLLFWLCGFIFAFQDSLVLGSGVSGESCLRIEKVLVDDSPVTASRDGAVQISGEAKSLKFLIKPRVQTEHKATRIMVRLDGVDSNWRDLPEGAMVFALQFLDAGFHLVGVQTIPIQGVTPGWDGGLASANFVQQSVLKPVPEQARWLRLELTSGRLPVVGTWLVSEISVGTRKVQPKLERPTQWDFSAARFNPDGEPVLEGWGRTGITRALRISTVVPVAFGTSPYALAIQDSEISLQGGWATTQTDYVPLNGVKNVTVRWSDCRSVGLGGEGTITYPCPPPGGYKFRVAEADAKGRLIGPEVAMVVRVVVPFWETAWFPVAVMGAISALLFLVLYQFSRRRMRRVLDRQKAVMEERERLARDLHDDLGANFTHIALLSELALEDLDNREITEGHLTRIFEGARGLARQLDDTVWALHSGSDDLENTATYISKLAQDRLRVAGIRCRLDWPEDLPNLLLASAVRLNLLMCIKEAIHNVVKHSKAKEVWLRILPKASELWFEVEDDGIGIAAELPAAEADGLRNMEARMRALGGTCHQSPGRDAHGTLIRLILPVGSQSKVGNPTTAP